ncbi:MAG: hypothetical protein R3290_01210 [Acidimicrobiia bacterium]|nr:hypothetical protein [Acidimicrobiia bacterium]
MATATAPALEERLDGLADRLDEIAAELREQRARREAWDELRSDLAPIATGVVANVTRELEDIQDDVDPADLLRLAKRLAANAARLDTTLERFESFVDLVDDVGPLTGEVVMRLTSALDEADRKGYFTFASHGMGVVDRIVTGFTEEDVDRLADNVVLILNTVKEMTQPEIMTMLQRTAVALEEDVPEAPSLRQMLRLMRDPGVRRGMARFLKAMQSAGGGGAEPTEDSTTTDHTTP